MIIFKQPLRTPDAPAGQAATAPAAKAAPNAPAPKATPRAQPPANKAAQAGPRAQAPAPTPENLNESAADRAIARKAASDAANAPRERPKRAQVQKLDDIKKLSSQNVRNPKTTTVETDDMALPEPKPEAPRAEYIEGRPDPKTARKNQEPVPDEALDTVIGEVENTDDFPNPEDLEQALVSEEEVQEKAFVPNLKFKAYGQEHDVPERFQSLITDAESEKEVKDVLTRAHAFDRTRERLTMADNYIERDLAPKLAHYDGIRAELGELAQAGDIFGLAERFGIDTNKVLIAAADRIRMEQADPSVRAMHEARVKAERESRESARRLNTLEAQAAETAASEKTRVFQSLLARDDVSALAATFDERQGKPGTFAKMIQQRAQSIYLNSKAAADAGRGQVIDLTPQQAILQFMQEYGLTLSPAAPGQTKATPQTPNKPTSQAPGGTRTPKTIPNIQSRPAAPGPGRPEIKSVKDIEKIRREKYGR